MGGESREGRINLAFVEIADTLIADFDIVDMLHTLLLKCVQILDTDAGGLMLVDAKGTLRVVASTSEDAGFVELMQIDANLGPCIECFRTATPVTVADIDGVGHRWPDFRTVALKHRFRSSQSIPMRLRGQTLGTMNLFSRRVGRMGRPDVAVAQALADVATIGILHERSLREVNVVSEQLQRALDSRVVIEQAKGMLAQIATIGMNEAFGALREYARSHNLNLRAVAEGVTSRTIAVDVFDVSADGTTTTSSQPLP